MDNNIIIRFNNIINDFKECLSNIEKDLNAYDNVNEDIIIKFPDIKRLIVTTLRADMIDVFKVIEDYIAVSLKSYGVGVSNKTLNQALDKCLEENLIKQEFRVMMKENKSIRDSYSHKYNYPSTEDLIAFYNENKETLVEHLAIMEEIMKNSKQEELF